MTERSLLTIVVTTILLVPGVVAGQSTVEPAEPRPAASWPSLDVTVQAGVMPLHFGGGDPGGASGTLWSGRVGYRPPLRGREAPRRLAIELSASRVAPGGWGSADPGVTTLGISLRESLRSVARPGHVDPFLGAGVSWLRVTPSALPVCEPPCMREGVKDWRDARFTMLMLGGGVVLPLPGALSSTGVRGDGRLHVPIQGPDEPGASEGTWVELSAGVRVTF